MRVLFVLLIAISQFALTDSAYSLPSQRPGPTPRPTPRCTEKYVESKFACDDCVCSGCQDPLGMFKGQGGRAACEEKNCSASCANEGRGGHKKDECLRTARDYAVLLAPTPPPCDPGCEETGVVGSWSSGFWLELFDNYPTARYRQIRYCKAKR
jgi:hypothetical protein